MRYFYHLSLLSFLLIAGCSSHQHQKYLGYIEGRYTYLSSKVSGHLQKLAIRKGEMVQAGALAYQLDPEPELAQLHAAQAKLAADKHRLDDLEKGARLTIIKRLEARVRKANSEVKLAQLMYDRDKKLIKSGAIGQAQLDRSRTAYQTALQELKAAEADLAEAKQGARTDALLAQAARVKAAEAEVTHLSWLLKQKRGYIPKSGMIENTFFREGEFVPAARPVASLLTPDNRILIFFIPQKKLAQLQMGKVVHFTCDGCDKSVRATVDFIGSRAEYTPPVIYSKDSRDKLVYYIEAKIDPKVVRQFHPGQPVQVRIE